MWMSLGLAVTFLVNVPFLGNVDVFKMLRNRQGHHPTAADSLPPVWRHASRLALENQFVFAELPPLSRPFQSLRLGVDPRALRIAVDPDSGMLSTAAEFGDVELG